MKYYDGCKLLSLKDLNGLKPEIYMCVGNRTAGKTTYFNRKVVNSFLKRQDEFMLVYRWANELSNIPQKFFTDINSLFFPDKAMTAKPYDKGAFIDLSIDKKHCGFAVALNTTDKLKKYSHLFSTVQSMVFDEFMSEQNKYCPNEIDKFLSLHTTVARGQGQQTRYVPIYMMANNVTILNPYYTAMGVSARLKQDTKFLRGNGWVLESTYNENAANALKQSGVNRAFANHNYVKFSAENVYLNDNDCLVEKMSGKSSYVCTIRYNNQNFSIRNMKDYNIMYCSKSVDDTYPLRYAISSNDVSANFTLVNPLLVFSLRNWFQNGLFRFADLECKECTLNLLSY